MCIYCGTDKYRKIYEQHYGTIPIDSQDRTYDIHHIDGDRLNNHPDNLIAVSINDHYNIHHSQGDIAACLMISSKMSLSPDDISRLARDNANLRVKQKTHPLLKRNDGSSVMKDRYLNGYVTPFAKRSDGTSIASDCYAAGKVSNFTTMTKDKHPRYDNTIYCFENKITGEKVKSTRYDFVRNYDVYETHITNLIHGKRKSTGGWVLITN
jgi:hypothetical protein